MDGLVMSRDYCYLLIIYRYPASLAVLAAVTLLYAMLMDAGDAMVMLMVFLCADGRNNLD
jgi:hypothetical protein